MESGLFFLLVFQLQYSFFAMYVFSGALLNVVVNGFCIFPIFLFITLYTFSFSL